jgi:Glycosyl transferase family 2
MPAEAPALSFIIPVRDDAARLDECLRRIAEHVPAGGAVEIVVADNGSRDGSAAVARRFGATVVELPGFRVGELRNRAAAAACGRILAFVDADNEIGADWIPAALDALRTPRVGAVGAPYVPPTPSTWVQRLYDRLRRHPRGREAVDWLGSGNLAVRRDAFEAVGGFDATLETCEDVDLCRKLRTRGYVLLADERMRNVHHGDPQTLGQVFTGELWRGRDNVRVSLRPPLSRRTLASAIVPVVNLAAAAMVVVGLLAHSRGGLWLAAGSAALVLVMVALRASLMLRPSWTSEWARALAVAAAYEAGRALAIAGRFGYRRRRRPVAA